MDTADLTLLEHSCRICMKLKENMHLIKECTYIGLDIYKMFNVTVPELDIRSESFDVLSQVICKICLKKLIISYNFHKLCIETNERLCDVLLKAQKMQTKESEAKIGLTPKVEVETDPLIAEDSEQISEDYSGAEIALANNETNDDSIEYLEDDENITALANDFIAAGREIVQVEIIEIELNTNKKENNNAVDANAKQKTPKACAGCKENFVTATQFRQHNCTHQQALHIKSDLTLNNSNQMRRKSKNEKYKCKCCAKIFTIRSHFLAHIKMHKNVELYKCDNCSSVFQDKDKLKQHVRLHAASKLHLCPTCGKAFSTASNLGVHVRLHTSLRSFQCTECPSRFSCRAYLMKHLSTVHAKIKPYVCEICDASFSRSDILAKHKYIHSGERPHKCDKCESSFVFIDHLRGHMRIHTGEKPYNCKYCDRSYAAGGDLTRHLRTHVGEKVYMCLQCPEAFKYKAELRLHSNIHYKVQEQTSEIS